MECFRLTQTPTSILPPATTSTLFSRFVDGLRLAALPEQHTVIKAFRRFTPLTTNDAFRRHDHKRDDVLGFRSA